MNPGLFFLMSTKMNPFQIHAQLPWYIFSIKPTQKDTKESIMFKSGSECGMSREFLLSVKIFWSTLVKSGQISIEKATRLPLLKNYSAF